MLATSNIDLKMPESECIDVTCNGQIYNFKRTNGFFATKLTIDYGEIFQHELLGKFEAIYQEDQKILSIQAAEAKGGAIRIRSNGWAKTKVAGESVGFL